MFIIIMLHTGYSDYNWIKFPLTPMWVLTPGSAYAWPSARPPINMSGKFSAHMSAKSPSNISPTPYELISKFSEPNDNFWKNLSKN